MIKHLSFTNYPPPEAAFEPLDSIAAEQYAGLETCRRLINACLFEFRETGLFTPQWIAATHTCLVSGKGLPFIVAFTYRTKYAFDWVDIDQVFLIRQNGAQQQVTTHAACMELSRAFLSMPGLPAANRETILEEIAQSCNNLRDAVGELPKLTHKKEQLIADFCGQQPLPDNRTRLLYTEQLPFTGHPTHVCSKTKTGFSQEELRCYNPEYGARVPLLLAEIQREALCEYGEATQWNRYLELQGLPVKEDAICLPLHPWQYRHVVQTTLGRYLANGLIKIHQPPHWQAWPTLSFRTLALPCPEQDATLLYQVKLPVQVQATSAVRTLSAQAVRNSISLSRLLSGVLRGHPVLSATCRIVEETYGAYFSPELSGQQVWKNLSFILRTDPVTYCAPNEQAMSMAALLHTDLPGSEPLIARLIRHTGMDTYAYFSRLLAVLLPTPLQLLLQYGISLELHGQNTLLVFCQGLPVRVLNRDLGGVRVWRDHAFIRQQVSLDGLAGPVCSSWDEAVAKLVHALYQNTLAQWVQCLHKYLLADQQQLWQLARNATDQAIALSSAAPVEQERLRNALFAPSLKVKSLLRMRLNDQSAEYLFAETSNPMHYC